jgi:hypothetical protein
MMSLLAMRSLPATPGNLNQSKVLPFSLFDGTEINGSEPGTAPQPLGRRA